MLLIAYICLHITVWMAPMMRWSLAQNQQRISQQSLSAQMLNSDRRTVQEQIYFLFSEGRGMLMLILKALPRRICWFTVWSFCFWDWFHCGLLIRLYRVCPTIKGPDNLVCCIQGWTETCQGPGHRFKMPPLRSVCNKHTFQTWHKRNVTYCHWFTIHLLF